jgi:hypothetical protein
MKLISTKNSILPKIPFRAMKEPHGFAFLRFIFDRYLGAFMA